MFMLLYQNYIYIIHYHRFWLISVCVQNCTFELSCRFQCRDCSCCKWSHLPGGHLQIQLSSPDQDTHWWQTHSCQWAAGIRLRLYLQTPLRLSLSPKFKNKNETTKFRETGKCHRNALHHKIPCTYWILVALCRIVRKNHRQITINYHFVHPVYRCTLPHGEVHPSFLSVQIWRHYMNFHESYPLLQQGRTHSPHAQNQRRAFLQSKHWKLTTCTHNRNCQVTPL